MTEIKEKDGNLYIKDLFRSKYQEKKVAFANYLKEALNISLDKFASQVFNNHSFENTDINKAEFILQLLNDEIKIEYWVFLRSKFQNLGYLTDRRHCEEYAFDIALGWLAEELIIGEIKKQASEKLSSNQKFKIGLMGIDAEREFQNLNIRAKADIFIDNDNRPIDEIHAQYEKETGRNAIWQGNVTKGFLSWREKHLYHKIDLFVDYKGTWQKNGYFDLKKGKIKHFKSDDLDWVLAFDVVGKQMYLISKDEALGYELTPNPAMGNVETANIPLTSPIVISELLDYLI
ncbi:MAG: hypothetical protein GF383_09790 [Candidatus Lokiarchaeota archaeon]|nr:hypothetical protein [Candidatus Lokiarchaeota archaeon]MBD3340815.1 hypothetical protein [Candidatus Lokiarchaeota archaeon]